MSITNGTQIAPGTIVVMKTGSPCLTIIKLAKDKAICEYWDGELSKKRTVKVHPNALETIEAFRFRATYQRALPDTSVVLDFPTLEARDKFLEENFPDGLHQDAH